MLNRFFKRDSENKKTGIYKLDGGKLIEFEEYPGNGSISSIIEELDFELSQIHTVHTFDSQIVECIGVKIFTKQVVFVLTKNKSSNLTISVLNEEINKVDWDFEYSRHTIEDILNDGIETKSLTLDFLNSVIDLRQEGDSVYLAPSLDLYLNFNDNSLDSFASSEWTNAASKWLKDINPYMFENMLSEANKYHNSEIEAMEEVNIQCNSLQAIPYAINNEFIPLHEKLTGNINFYNLLAAHYGGDTNIEEFKIVNKGRFILQNEYILEVDGFIYRFGSDGKLTNASQK